MEALSIIKTFAVDFITILGEMSPYLLLGFFFAGLLHAYMPRHTTERYFSGRPFMASLRAALLGIPLPLCSCGVIPTGTALYRNGASKGGTVSFLISTPQTGVDSVLATFSLLGLPFALIRPLAALVTGVTGGWLTAKITRNETGGSAGPVETEKAQNWSQKLLSAFRYGFVEFIEDISKWLVIGLVLAALISALIPDNFFNVLNLPPVLQMLMILVVSVPLYVCATGTIPLAAVLIMKGISPGAAFVLLMAGPATNAATITMIGKVLGRRSLLVYLFTIIAGALLFGLAIDYVLPSHWFTLLANEHAGHHHDGGILWWQMASALILAGLIIHAYFRKLNRRIPEEKQIQNQNTMSTQIIRVEGMTCNHCKMNVENNLKKLDFIDNAVANLSEQSVSISGDHLDLEKVKATVEALGYTCK